MYTAALSAGVSGGVIISGLITIKHSWRYIYYVATALIGALTLLVFFTLPETAFNRSPVDVPGAIEAPSELYKAGRMSHDDVSKGADAQYLEDTTMNTRSSADQEVPPPPRDTFLQSLRISHGRFTDESVWKMAYRPVVLLVLPPVLWATLVMSVTIGFLVAISSNFATAFSTTYGFEPYQSGLCFISGLVGTLFGIFGGGTVSDWVADHFTKRNGGIREPEMRLPAMTIALICAPLGLVLYGVGIDSKLHWIVPTLGLGFRKFFQDMHVNINTY